MKRSRRAPLPRLLVDNTGCEFDRERHVYVIDKVPVPSVTQVLGPIEEGGMGFVDFSEVPRHILDQAKIRGTYVHKVLHFTLERDYDLPDVDPRYKGYVDSALAYLERAALRPLRLLYTADGAAVGEVLAPNDERGQIVGVEYRFWDRARRFAGTMDYVAWDPDDILTINDWKTGEPDDVAAPLQTAAYEHGLRLTLFPDHGFPIRRRAIKLFKDGKPGRVEPYGPETGHSYVQDIGTFFSALNCVHYRRNGMRHRPLAA